MAAIIRLGRLKSYLQVVRLIRSKGVGVYFVTQNPLDVPEAVLGQLGNRVQHALRAFTPRDQKAVRTAATTLRQNPELDTERAITELAVGEALVSMLDEKGRPGIVQRAWILAPGSRIGPATPDERREVIRSSVLFGQYEKEVDRESAYEKLRQAATARAQAGDDTTADNAGSGAQPAGGGGVMDVLGGILMGSTGPRGGRREGMLEAAAKSAARSVGSQLGRQIMRGVLGGLLSGSARSRR